MIERPVLIVDDESEVLECFELTIMSGGITPIVCLQDSREVLPFLENNEIDVMLLDLTMPHIKGQDLLRSIRKRNPEIAVIIVTATDDIETAVECVKTGAFDYLLKPVEKMRLISCVQRALEKREMDRENRALRERVLHGTIENPSVFSSIITGHAKMHGIFQYIEAIAPSKEPALITGETGVGKELIAKAIHNASRRAGSFVAVNVAGLDDVNFSDTLFGHKKGAFTGANERRKGVIQEATKGTLFLDEIGDLNAASQIKLLRLLQEREYLPLGCDLPQRADTRIIAATNLDLEALESSNQFRKDLYYRLRTHHIHVPPLRQRLSDLPLLVDYFLDKAARSLQKKKPTPPEELFGLLSTYHFPGNIRELQSMVFDAVAQHKSRMLSLEIFRCAIFGDQKEVRHRDFTDRDKNTLFSEVESLPTLKKASRELVQEALTRAHGNQTLAAQMLGISQPALSKRLKKNEAAAG